MAIYTAEPRSFMAFDGLPWLVSGGRHTISDLTEAEAHIIAWALNRVAEGKVIVALVPPDAAPDGPQYAGFYCEDYVGPTDGVAP